MAATPADGPIVRTSKVFIARGTGASEVTVTFLSEAQFHTCWACINVIWFPATEVPPYAPPG